MLGQHVLVGDVILGLLEGRGRGDGVVDLVVARRGGALGGAELRGHIVQRHAFGAWRSRIRERVGLEVRDLARGEEDG